MRLDALLIKANESIFAICLAAIIPIKPLVLLVGVCISLDTFFGVFRAYKQGKKITSRELSSVISKMALYELVLILFFFIDSLILNDIAKTFTPVDLFMTKVVAAVLISVEVLSILENIKIATGHDFIGMAKKTLKRGKSVKDEVQDIIN